MIIFPLNLSPGLAQRVKCQKCDSQAVKYLWNNQKLRQEIIDEIDEIDAKKVERVVFCSGKVYYELLQERRKLEQDNIAIVRVEQLYPFPEQRLQQVLEGYPNLETLVWCQEEPRNNGAWFFVNERIEASLAAAGKDGMRPTYAGREEAASPATGLAKRHQAQQEALVTIALGLADGGEAKRALKKKEIAEKKV